MYAIGHTAPSLLAAYMAAVLAGGPGAVLSHRAAAYLLKLWRGLAPAPEITVPSTAERSRPGVVIHRVRSLHPRDVCVVDGIPVTIVPRVLLDLAPSLAPAELTRACHEAWVHHRVTPEMVEACIARNPHKKGAAKLRRALGSDVTLSKLEDLFLALPKAHGVPLPRTNIDVEGDKVDCHWEQHRLTVELITFRYHATRYGFENDNERRRRSSHVAYTYGDIVERGDATVADLSHRLEQAAAALDDSSASRNLHYAPLSYARMRRTLVIAGALLACAMPAPVHAAAAAKPPKLGATLETCATSPLPVQRIAAFVGSMPARANAPRMQMRFELERRHEGERRWRRLKAEGFGVWERAKPNVAGFVFTKRVTGLPVPATYRALVRFRWLAADGATVKRAHARTPACRQPDLRPNLVPGALTGALDAQQAGLAVYSLVVRNTGRSAAGPFSVRVGGASAEVEGLEAGEERAVTVSGLACVPLLAVVVRVDADRRIEESAERGNGARRQCPLALG